VAPDVIAAHSATANDVATQAPHEMARARLAAEACSARGNRERINPEKYRGMDALRANRSGAPSPATARCLAF
jgi:hypothetical protein